MFIRVSVYGCAYAYNYTCRCMFVYVRMLMYLRICSDVLFLCLGLSALFDSSIYIYIVNRVPKDIDRIQMLLSLGLVANPKKKPCMLWFSCVQNTNNMDLSYVCKYPQASTVSKQYI